MEEKYLEILRHYVNPNDCKTVMQMLLNLHNVSQRSELLPKFLMKDLDGKIITAYIGGADVTKEWKEYLGNCG